MVRATRATWAKRVETWRRSGLSAKEFAAKHGLRARTLSWWSWRLGGDAHRGRAAAPSVDDERTIVAPLTFVEMTSTVSREPIEIVLRNEVRVRVDASFDVDALARVLDVLERR